MPGFAERESALRRLGMFWAVLACCLFLPVLDFSFFADDEIYLAFSNRQLRELQPSALYQLLLRPANPWEFLPVRDFSYWLDLYLFGDDGFALHATNFLLYLLAALSANWFIREMLLRRNSLNGDGGRVACATAALWGMVFFLLHPAHVEAVAWISGRKDILAGLFSLAMLASLLRWLRLCAAGADGHAGNTANRFAFGGLPACLFFTLACFSKSTAVAMVLPATAILCNGLLAPRLQGLRRQVFAEILAIWAIAVAALFIHLHFGVELGIRIDNAPGLAVSVARASRILASLLRLLFIPADLGLLHDVYQLGEWHWYVSAAALLLALAAFATAIRNASSVWSIAVLLVVAPLLPYLQLAPFSTWSMASERFVFVPVAGIALLLATGFRIGSRPQSLAGLASVLFAAFAVVTWVRLGDWRSPQSLFEHEYRRQPANYIAVRDYVLFNLLPADPVRAHEVIDGVSRADAREILSLLAKVTLEKHRAERSGEPPEATSSYCRTVGRLLVLQEAGRRRLRTEPDLPFSNLLRSVDRHLYYALGNPQRRCKLTPGIDQQ